MFEKTYYATHPDMMAGATNAELRDRYLVSGLFRPGEIVLTYSHGERFIIGGAVPAGGVLALPRQSAAESAAGHPLLERREMSVVNIGTVGTVTVDGQRHARADAPPRRPVRMTGPTARTHVPSSSDPALSHHQGHAAARVAASR